MNEQIITSETALKEIIKGKRVVIAVPVTDEGHTAWVPTTRDGADNLWSTVEYRSQGKKILVASQAWEGAVLLTVRNRDYILEAK